ncbi:MAG: DUF6088 family protein [Phycisphaerales bacterium]
MATDKDRIIARIRRWGPGSAFTPKDFLDVASRGTVDMTLKAMVDEGRIRRLARGLYDAPSHSKRLGGPAGPQLDQVAHAIARRFRWTIIPDGPLAANLLGLSTQVPARPVYISDGPSKVVVIDGQRIQFKSARPRETGVMSARSGTVIQALRSLGRRRVDEKVIGELRRILSAQDKRALVRDARQSADWIYAAARAIATERR